MAKQSKYSSKDEVDSLATLANKLAVDLRYSIRSLGSFEIMSPQWLIMSDIFGRIATVTEMEAQLAASKNNATLWETEEQAIRFLIEDGKLNQCLRSMVELKKYQRTVLSEKSNDWVRIENLSFDYYAYMSRRKKIPLKQRNLKGILE